jgi:peroxiredoxin Q/BCP
MAQLRRDYNKFTERETEILVVGPDDTKAFSDYWDKQKVKLLQMGRMPAQVLIDKSGRIRYRHFGNSMSDITDNRQILALLDELNQEVENDSKKIHA